MLVLEDVSSNGTRTEVTLHGDISIPTHPRTELTQLMDRVYQNNTTNRLMTVLGISGLDVHQLRNGSKSCDIEEVKRMLKQGGIDYE